jgi:hypothetical protein
MKAESRRCEENLEKNAGVQHPVAGQKIEGLNADTPANRQGIGYLHNKK